MPQANKLTLHIMAAMAKQEHEAIFAPFFAAVRPSFTATEKMKQYASQGGWRREGA